MMKFSVILMLLGAVTPAAAQRVTLGAGVNAGSMPRALNSICASPRQLNGGGLSATAGLQGTRIRLAATFDFLSNGGTMAVASCVPLPPGISVDSTYADAGTSANALSATASIMPGDGFDVGVQAGWVLDHDSWFIGPVVGGQYRFLRAEAVGRLHRISFQEVTRDYDGTTVREVGRTDETERTWGIAVRLLVMTGRTR
jgi:hypothetical protein